MQIRNRRNRVVYIAVPEGPRITVEAEAEIDLPDALAKSLLEQPDRWEAVSTKSTKKAAKSGEEA